MDISGVSPYTEYLQSQLKESSGISQDIKSKNYDNASDEELLDACKEFESYFLEQVFKGMQKTVDIFKDEDSISNYSNSMVDYFRDETISELAKTSTETNGLGLAQTLYEQMKRNYDL